MKNVIISIASILLLSCSGKPVVSTDTKEIESRIILIDRGYANFVLLNVDDCEYLARYDGGLVHLENCKNHK